MKNSKKNEKEFNFMAEVTPEKGFVETTKKEFNLSERIEFVINNWYGRRRGTELRALNEFVQRHVIVELIDEINKINKEFIKKYEEIINWISKEVNIQPTDKTIRHLKDQIICYIIPKAKEKLNKLTGDKLT